ncbi:dicarboxylate transporter 2.1, chloroplastic-like [Andrographis paniculata]|uniref:dicarboxylate transporter 2.1, chloroplastic-like n=1 Tax=Andrographis paniculata TaxID=175694 RepID=UPI0021E7664C|nr:dicarboxylate transporter 2.1, chloroplastic-like [Andrographis paniculata]
MSPPPPPAAGLPTHISAVRRCLAAWNGARPAALLICAAVGLILRFGVPKPGHVTPKAWSLLSIFVATVAGLILGPLPVGAWAFVCVTVTVVTKTLSFAAAFSAFTNEVIWLVVAAFFLSRGFVKTGLGDRVAMVFVRWLGKSTLGLSYGLVLGELAISPGMPSSTARAGGIFVPIIKSLAAGAESQPKDPSARRLGAYLILSQMQSSNSSGAFFITAAAQNLLCIKLAESLGVEIKHQWVTWLKASCIPAGISLLSTPFLLYKIYPPKLRTTPEAPAMAKQRLEQMGAIKREEWIMIGTLLLTVGLWVAGEALNMANVVTAMVGLSILLLCGVLDWNDCLSDKQAWDTLTWFAILIGMATELNVLGVVPWLSGCVSDLLKHLSLSTFGTFSLLQLSYFFIHYLFASQTAHVGALYSAFLSMQLSSGVPKLLAALALAYNTNLFGCITHYSSGQAAVYYGAGYVELRDLFPLGLAIALINLVIWALVGAAWWKILGLY